MRYIYSKDKEPSQSLLGWLLSFNVTEVKSLSVQTGYFSDGGLSYVSPLIKATALHQGEVWMVVGANDKGTSEEDARLMWREVSAVGGRCGVCVFRGALFHPKVIHVERTDGSSAAYVGSANLTEQGARQNVEAGLLLDSREGDPLEVLTDIKRSVVGWFEGQDKAFYELDDAVIKRLVKRKVLGEGRAWRAGPVEQPTGSMSTTPRPKHSGRAHIISTTEVKRALRAQERALAQATQAQDAPTEPVVEEPVVEEPVVEAPVAEVPVVEEPVVEIPPSPPKPKRSKRSQQPRSSVQLIERVGELVSCSVQGVGFKMAYCPAGEFWMGSEKGWMGSEKGVGYRYRYERPRHRVKISKPFLMGQTQVTQALWQAVVGENPSRFEGSDLPVEQVSWFDMVRFCNRLSELENFRPAYGIGSGDKPNVSLDFSANGYRLPTEAEWEYAAKAGTELVYAGSDNVDEVAWCAKTTNIKGTRPVATKKPNAWGLYDMSGNVWEWCNDQQDNKAYKFRKSRPEVNSDPCNYASAFASRVYRGGGWRSGADICRVTNRSSDGAIVNRYEIGGRLLRWNIDR